MTLECGSFAVPESRQRPTGRTIRLQAAILRAPRPTSLPPLVLLHGGPGQSGLDLILQDAAALPLSRQRDVIVNDQRGAGYSEPVLCPDYNRRRGEALARAGAGRSAVEREAPAVRSCLATLRDQGIDPSAFTTAESAKDLADLRRVLGYETWDVSGDSYGGRLALAALAVDPQGIRSVVLFRPGKPMGDRAEYPLRIQHALDRLFAACASDVACARTFPDPAADLMAGFKSLEARPLRVALPDAASGSELVLDGAVLVHALAGGLNTHAGIGRIPFLLRELRRGNRTRAAREIAGWAAAQHADASATLSLVPCNDEYGPRALTREDSALAAVSLPVRAIGRIRSVRTCALWTGRVDDPEPPGPPASRVPVLLFAGEYDTAGANPEAARSIASSLGTRP